MRYNSIDEAIAQEQLKTAATCEGMPLLHMLVSSDRRWSYSIEKRDGALSHRKATYEVAVDAGKYDPIPDGREQTDDRPIRNYQGHNTADFEWQYVHEGAWNVEGEKIISPAGGGYAVDSLGNWKYLGKTPESLFPKDHLLEAIVLARYAFGKVNLLNEVGETCLCKKCGERVDVKYNRLAPPYLPLCQKHLPGVNKRGGPMRGATWVFVKDPTLPFVAETGVFSNAYLIELDGVKYIGMRPDSTIVYRSRIVAVTQEEYLGARFEPGDDVIGEWIRIR